VNVVGETGNTGMGNIVKQLANRMGYELKRRYGTLPQLEFLETLLLGALAAEEALNIIQVGANDGSHSDPIHRFLMSHPHRTTALLIEPQPEIITYLQASYADHPGASIYNGAIGSSDQLVLYRIRPELWDSFRVSYLKGAPAYCAPSGLTSANRAHVVAAAGRYLKGKIAAEDAVEELQVPCRQLKPLLDERGFPAPIHLLQVDAEGADDEVLYACNIDALRPAIINFESKHLEMARQAALETYLAGHGYTLHQWKRTDTVALRLGDAAGDGITLQKQA
jgi:FkbM family methyltransferase